MFGETAIVTVTIRRANPVELEELRVLAIPTQLPSITTEGPQLRSLADTATALKKAAAVALHGSKAHRVLSEWSDAIDIVGDNLRQ